MPTIARPISSADLDHYEGHLINVTARALAKRSESEWDAASPALRNRWRKKALAALTIILADEGVVQRLPILTRTLLKP